jgi:hypothetical protein
MKWVVYAFFAVAIWYVYRKVGDEVFVAIDRRVYPEKV